MTVTQTNTYKMGDAAEYNDRYTFIAQWRDNDSGILRTFHLSYFISDGTLELTEIHNRKLFMKRTLVRGIKLEDIYVGAGLRILGRIIHILDFACENTKYRLASSFQRTFALIKPVPNTMIGDIIQVITDKGFKIVGLIMTALSKEQADDMYRSEKGKNFLPYVIEYIVQQPVIGMKLVGNGVIQKWKEAMGHYNPAKAEPGTIRKRFAQGPIKNAVHGADGIENAKLDLEMFFPRDGKSVLKLTPTFKNCTCCIIKPHAINDGNMGNIISSITSGGFKVTAMKIYNLDTETAREFYEVYKEVVTEYQAMIEELTTSACLVLEVVSIDPNVSTPNAFRKLCGFVDPEIARVVDANCIRARFGHSRVKNAVHCTDLEEDAILEVEYFFKILE